MHCINSCRRRVALGALVAALWNAAAVRADGLLQTLPADGRRVRFDVAVRYFDPRTGKERRKAVGSQSVSSVGRETYNDEPCRRIELTLHMNPGSSKPEEEFSETFRLLLPEEQAVAGHNPLDHIRRAWLKMTGGGEPTYQQELPVENQLENLRENAAYQLHGPLPDARRLDPVTIDGPAGKLTCAGVAGSVTVPIDNKEGGATTHAYETRLHPEVPFGVVRHRCEFTRRDAAGMLFEHQVWTFTLKAIEQDAQSEIPEDLDPTRAFRLIASADRLLERGLLDAALRGYADAISLAPSFAMGYDGRGRAHHQLGEYPKAIDDFEESIRRDPKYFDPLDHLAWLLATCPEEAHRDGKRAVELATRACELTQWKNADKLATLAAAQAEAGDFAAALRWQEQALELAGEKEREEYTRRLDDYKAGKPLREDRKQVEE